MFMFISTQVTKIFAKYFGFPILFVMLFHLFAKYSQTLFFEVLIFMETFHGYSRSAQLYKTYKCFIPKCLRGVVAQLGVWRLNGSAPGCHSAVPGLNPASLNLQEHVSSLLGSQQGWHSNCRHKKIKGKKIFER